MVTEDVPPLPSHPPRRPSLENVEVTDNLFPDDVPGAGMIYLFFWMIVGFYV